MTQHQIGLQLRPPQIEVAVLEAQILRRQLFGLPAGDWNGGRLGRPHDLERGRVHFDLASRELRILHVGRTGDDFALHHDHGLRPETLGAGDDVGRGPSRTERHLDDAVAVAQVEEDDSSQVAAPVDPTPQAHPLADVLPPQRPTAVAAPGCPSHRSVYAPPLSASQRMR